MNKSALIFPILFLLSLTGFGCKKPEPGPPPQEYPEVVWPGDTIPVLITPVTPEKINLLGVVLNAVPVSAKAPLKLKLPFGARLSFAAGVLAEPNMRRVSFEVRTGGQVLAGFFVGHRPPEGWHEVEVQLPADAQWVTITCDLPDRGAFIANPRVIPTGDKRPSVLFILVDALRADGLGVDGAGGDPSPNLDALARSGAVFMRDYTASPFTMTSVASIFTGLFPWQHKVLFTGETSGLTLSASVPTLVESFRAAGYHTAAFSGTYFRFSRNGFARGFDVFDETCADSFFRDSADCLNQRLLPWLAAHADEPCFVYVHYVDTHAPYYPPEPFRSRFTAGLKKPWHNDVALGEIGEFTANRPWYQFYRRPSSSDLAYLRGLYQGEVAYVDSRIGEVLKKVREEKPADRPAPFIVITADHGEAFYEHGVIEHVADLHDPVMRVPFILAGPGVPARKFNDLQVRSLDLMPTLLDLAKIELPPGISGRSLTPIFRGERLEPVPAVALHAPEGKSEYALVLWPWKLFWQPEADRAFLYRLDLDPAETKDLSAQYPAQLQDLKLILNRLTALGPPSSGQAPPGLDSETIKRLKALVYIPN